MSPFVLNGWVGAYANAFGVMLLILASAPATPPRGRPGRERRPAPGRSRPEDAPPDTRSAGREVLGAAAALGRSLGVFMGRAGGASYQAARSSLTRALDARRQRRIARPASAPQEQTRAEPTLARPSYSRLTALRAASGKRPILAIAGAAILLPVVLLAIYVFAALVTLPPLGSGVTVNGTRHHGRGRRWPRLRHAGHVPGAEAHRRRSAAAPRASHHRHRGPALLQPFRHRPARARPGLLAQPARWRRARGRLDHHAAICPARHPEPGEDPLAQDAGGPSGAPRRGDDEQGRDPARLSGCRLFRGGRLWRGCRRAALFRQPAKALTLSEAAMLAGLVRAPSQLARPAISVAPRSAPTWCCKPWSRPARSRRRTPMPQGARA